MPVPYTNPYNLSPLTHTNGMWIDDSGEAFEVVGGVPRFVPQLENYTESFGRQWNIFRETQIDQSFQSSFSSERFFAESGWSPETLANLDVLEVGGGAGRFTRVLLEETEAYVHTVDYSSAVDANYKNNGHYDRLRLSQASVYELPFPRESFDRVFCFGVLQHTPDVKHSVRCLAEQVKPGGALAVDFYPIRGPWTFIHSKYLLRPLTKRLPHNVLLNVLNSSIDTMLAATDLFERIGAGRILNRFIPICATHRSFPDEVLESRELRREWALMDTFDAFSPEHDHPQRIKTVASWFREFGLEVTFADYCEYRHGHQAAVVRGKKPLRDR